MYENEKEAIEKSNSGYLAEVYRLLMDTMRLKEMSRRQIQEQKTQSRMIYQEFKQTFLNLVDITQFALPDENKELLASIRKWSSMPVEYRVHTDQPFGTTTKSTFSTGFELSDKFAKVLYTANIISTK